MRKPMKFKECISCTAEMNAIHCYTIRTECSECGGKALTEYDRESSLLKRTRKPAKAA